MSKLYEPVYTDPWTADVPGGNNYGQDPGSGGLSQNQPTTVLSREAANTRNEIEYLKAVNSAQNPLLDNRMRILQDRLKKLESRRSGLMDQWDDAKVQRRRDIRTADYQRKVAVRRKRAVKRIGDEATALDRRQAEKMMADAKAAQRQARQSAKPGALSHVNRKTNKKITDITKKSYSTTQRNLSKIPKPPRGPAGVTG